MPLVAGRPSHRTTRLTATAVAAAVLALTLGTAPGSAVPRSDDPLAAPTALPPTTGLACTPTAAGSWGEQRTSFDLAVTGAGATSLGCTPGTVGNSLTISAAVTSAPTDGVLTLGGVTLTATTAPVPLTSGLATLVAIGDGDYTLTVTVTEVDGSSAVVETLSETITFQAVSPPVCYPIQLYGLINDGSSDVLAQYNNNVNLAFDPATGSGCFTTSNFPLTFAITDLYHSTLTPGAGDGSSTVRTLVPELGYVVPQDWLLASQTITFTVRATDALGQASLNQVAAAKGVPVAMQVSAPVSATCAVQPPDMRSQTYFNNPVDYSNPDNRFNITDRMIEYIDCAGAIAQADFAANGSSNVVILMSWFSLTDKDVVTALVRAQQRHANVRFLINSHATKSVSSSYPSWTGLRKALGTTAPTTVRDATTPGGSWALYCDAGCLTPPCISSTGVDLCKNFPVDSEAEYPAMHSKFFTILYPAGVDGKQTTVVGIASSNPTREQALRGWNNMQVVVERAASWTSNPLFKSINTYARDLASQGLPAVVGGNPTAPAAYRKLSNVGQTSFVVFPRSGTGGSTDNITQLLNGVKCRYLDSKGRPQRTQIYVNMFVFTRNSPAMKLWRLAFNPPRDKSTGGGCDVRIIYTDMDSAIRSVTPGSTYGKWLTKKGPNVAYGAADCLSAPGTLNGRWRSMLGTSRIVLLNSAGNPVRNSKGKYRYVKAFVCNRGALQGRMPTINTYNKSLCWLNRSSKVSGGSLSMCVSTPLKLTPLDPADLRAKLEYWPDANNHYSYSHQKYMLINGMYEGKVQKVTISGTPNFSNPGLRWNDEIMTITTGATTFNQYLANFNRMRNYIKNRPGPRAVKSNSSAFCRATGTTPCDPAS